MPYFRAPYLRTVHFPTERAVGRYQLVSWLGERHFVKGPMRSAIGTVEIPAFMALQLRLEPPICENLAALADLDPESLLVLDARTLSGTPACPSRRFGAIAHLTGLHELHLPGGVSDEAVAHLQRLRLLEVLSADGSTIGDLGLHYLSYPLALRELYLSSDQTISQRGLAVLAVLPKLRTLHLSETLFEPDALSALRRFPALRELDLSEDNLAADDIAPLSTLTDLAELSLWGNHISDAGLRHLAPLVQLRNLDLAQNPVTADGVRWLERYLPECRISPSSVDITWYNRHLRTPP